MVFSSAWKDKFPTKRVLEGSEGLSPNLLARSCLAPSVGAGRAEAKLTLISRPSTSFPFISSTALVASSTLTNSTYPNPRDFWVVRSNMTRAEEISPNWSNSDLSQSLSTFHESLPTKTLAEASWSPSPPRATAPVSVLLFLAEVSSSSSAFRFPVMGKRYGSERLAFQASFFQIQLRLTVGNGNGSLGGFGLGLLLVIIIALLLRGLLGRLVVRLS